MFLYLENLHGKIEAVNTDQVIRVVTTEGPPNAPADSPDEWMEIYLMPDGKYKWYKGTVRDFVITVEKLSDPQNVPPVPPG